MVGIANPIASVDAETKQEGDEEEVDRRDSDGDEINEYVILTMTVNGKDNEASEQEVVVVSMNNLTADMDEGDHPVITHDDYEAENQGEVSTGKMRNDLTNTTMGAVFVFGDSRNVGGTEVVYGNCDATNSISFIVTLRCVV